MRTKKHADRASAKSSLESYAFSLRSTLQDEKVAGKIEKEDKEKLEKLVKSTIDWVSEHENADKDEYESKNLSWKLRQDQSFPRYIKALEVEQEECQAALILHNLVVVAAAAVTKHPLQVLLRKDQKLKKWIKTSFFVHKIN